MKFLIVFIITILSFYSFAVPTLFSLSENSLVILDQIDSLNKIEVLKAPHIDKFELIFRYLDNRFGEKKKPIPKGFLKKLRKENLIELEKKYKPQVIQYFENIAKENNAIIYKDENAKVFSFQNGVKFFKDLYSFKDITDPMLKAMIETLLSNSERQKSVSSPLERLIVGLRENFQGQTQLLSVSEYTEEDLKLITEIVPNKNYRFEKIGNVWLLGSGFSFHATRDILNEGFKLQNSKLKSKFEKIISYHISFQIPITHTYRQGPVAYYSPSSNEMSFVLMSRGNLNSYTHEMTHSRFNKFSERLDSWIKSKGYSVPFQIDGPRLDGLAGIFQTHGGLFNLLNEVNSWRIGESFDGNDLDQKILKTLVELYGPQAGHESTELLTKVWTPEKLKDKSIPYLIYSEIREFNMMSNDQLVMMGYEGVFENDLVKKMNFLIMFKAKRFQTTSVESDAEFVLEEINRTSIEKTIRQTLKSINKRFVDDQSITPQMLPEASNMGFTETFEQFINNESDEVLNLLKKKFISQILPEHIERLIENAIKPDSGGFLEKPSIDLLKTIFKSEKITRTVYFKDGVPIIRSPTQSAFLEALDNALIKYLYNGGIATTKIDLLNFIAETFHPQELPKTYAKTVENLLATGDRTKPDVWLARLFFRPSQYQSRDLYLNVLWGDKLIQDLFGTMLPNDVKEAFGFFYKESYSLFLSKNSYGKDSDLSLTKNLRLKTQREIQQLTSEQKKMLEIASKNLWVLAGDSDAKVRTSALYAILSNPSYLISNEGRISQALLNKEIKYSSSIPFLLDVGEELIPDAKRIYKIQFEKRMKNSCRSLFK